ncbi:MAG: hypothetical protein AAFV43_02325 [Planctomycetota bacterium]
MLSATLGVATAGATVTITGDADTNESRTFIGGESYGSIAVTSPSSISTQELQVGSSRLGVGDLTIDNATVDVLQRGDVGAVGVGRVTLRNGGRLLMAPFQSHVVGGDGYGSIDARGPGTLVDYGTSPFGFQSLSVGGWSQFGGQGLGRGELRFSDGAELRTVDADFGMGGSADVVIDGAGTNWLLRGSAAFGAAELTISDGGRVIALGQDRESSIDLGASGASTTAYLTGAGSSLWLDGVVTVGSSGSAVLRIDDGADLATQSLSIGGQRFGSSGQFSASGIVELTGFGSSITTQDLALGAAFDSLAELRLSDGASLSLQNQNAFDNGVVLGAAAGSSVLLTIDGRDTRFSAERPEMFVGSQGYGELRITGGASHTSGFTRVGNFRGRVEVSGTSSQWRVGERLEILNGELTIADGGQVSVSNGVDLSSEAVLGLDDGTLEVTGNGVANGGLIRGSGVIAARVANLKFNGRPDAVRIRVGQNEKLQVGELYNETVIEINGGELEIREGQSVDNLGEIRLIDGMLTSSGMFGQTQFRNSGRLVAAAGDSLVVGDILIGGAPEGIQVLGDSTLTIRATDVVNAHDSIVESDATLVLAGQYSSGAIGGGGTVRFESVVSYVPDDDSRFDVAFEADVEFTASSTLLETIDLSASDEPIIVSGSAILDGRLEFNFASGEEPMPLGIAERVLLEAASLVGEFDTDLEPGDMIDDRTVFRELVYRPTELAVVTETFAAGDLNTDGVISLSDYDAWVEAFGQDAWRADGNGDGTVDLADYTVWRDAYDEVLALAAVPEPGSLTLIALAASVCVRRVRR